MFSLIDEAQNIEKKDIHKFKMLTDQASFKAIRTFCMLFFFFLSLLYVVLILV